MANLYTFINAEQITVFQPPNGSQTMQQVTAEANTSGIIFLHQFLPEVYKIADSVVNTLNGLASGFNEYATVAGVEGIQAVQEIDSQNQLADKIDVTVLSTSGKSSTVFRTTYPMVDFFDTGYLAFIAAVEKQRAQLDAVENG
jgi:hypothetical protein